MIYTKGSLVLTTIGWIGKVTSIDEKAFKHDQGVNVTRIDDGAKFSISQGDVKEVVHPDKLIDYFKA